MRKVLLSLFIGVLGVSLAACDGAKDGGGSSGVTNTPVVEGDYATYSGNYNITAVSYTDGSNAFSSDDKKQILDVGGQVIVTGADANGINFGVGLIQLGGNYFMTAAMATDNDTSVIERIVGESVTGKVTAVEAGNVLKVVYPIKSEDGGLSGDYSLTMTKNNDSVVIIPAAWRETPIAIPANPDNVTVNEALTFIGSYYVYSMEVICDNGTGTSTAYTYDMNAANNVVGELGTSVTLDGNGVTLQIALKYQLNSAACSDSFPAYQYHKIDDKILVPNIALPDLNKIFTVEGLNLQGTETIGYIPQNFQSQREPDGKVSYTGSIKYLNGAEVKIILKKARDGSLLEGFPKTLEDARYY